MFIIMRINKSILFLFFALATGSSSAQVNDAGLWASVNLEKNIIQKLTAEFSQEFRMNENISELGSFFSEAGMQYRFSKRFAVSAGYRFSNKRRLDDSYSKRHRILFNVNYREKISDLTVAIRLRYQSQYRDVNSSDDGKVPENYFRSKITFKYDLKKRITPFLSGETFVYLNRPEGMLFDNYRLSAGLEYEFSKKSSVDLGYLIDREINKNDPLTGYIIALGWNYRL